MIIIDDAVYPKGKKMYCHMASTTSVRELHDFAASMGIRRCWYHYSKRHPHYDLTADQRIVAIELGATPVSSVRLLELLKGVYAT